MKDIFLIMIMNVRVIIIFILIYIKKKITFKNLKLLNSTLIKIYKVKYIILEIIINLLYFKC
jgi:hypothetical protein